MVSPLRRAVETAELIGKNGSMPEGLLASSCGKDGKTIFQQEGRYTVDERLKEQNFGIFEGKTYEDL